MKKTSKSTRVTGIYRIGESSALHLPVYVSKVPAGFPSPADDFVEQKLSLDEHFIRNRAATFIVKVSGDSMLGAGIHPGDHLIVDRSLEVRDRRVVVAALDGELVVKRIRRRSGRLYLESENPGFQPIEVGDASEFSVWGVVTYVIHQL
jgi:DNA polymerase V